MYRQEYLNERNNILTNCGLIILGLLGWREGWV